MKTEQARTQMAPYAAASACSRHPRRKHGRQLQQYCAPAHMVRNVQNKRTETHSSIDHAGIQSARLFGSWGGQPLLHSDRLRLWLTLLEWMQRTQDIELVRKQIHTAPVHVQSNLDLAPPHQSVSSLCGLAFPEASNNTAGIALDGRYSSAHMQSRGILHSSVISGPNHTRQRERHAAANNASQVQQHKPAVPP